MTTTLLVPSRWEDQCSLEENGLCGISSPSKICTAVLFIFFSIFCVSVVQLHLPGFSVGLWATSVDRSQSVHLYIIIVIKSSQKEVRVSLLWANPALSVLHKADMYDTKDTKYVNTCEDL